MIKIWISRTLTSMVITLIMITVLSIILKSMNYDSQIPYLSELVKFVHSTTGLFIFLGLPGLYLIVIQAWKLFRLLTQAETLKH